MRICYLCLLIMHNQRSKTLWEYMASIIFYQFFNRNHRKRILKNDLSSESPNQQHDENDIFKNSSYFKSAFKTGINKNTGYGKSYLISYTYSYS